jgi:hypothetical protein
MQPNADRLRRILCRRPAGFGICSSRRERRHGGSGGAGNEGAAIESRRMWKIGMIAHDSLHRWNNRSGASAPQPG